VPKQISHDFLDETMVEKARWFQSLSLAERMDMLCMFTDMILTANPQIMEKKNAEPIAESVHVLRRA
jgi:hypothetical protein